SVVQSNKLNTLVTKLHEFLGHSPDNESIDSQDISNGKMAASDSNIPEERMNE
ncbi:hypothetical protein cypCar_00041306, partial [Cyprinus carpio]